MFIALLILIYILLIKVLLDVIRRQLSDIWILSVILVLILTWWPVAITVAGAHLVILGLISLVYLIVPLKKHNY